MPIESMTLLPPNETLLQNTNREAVFSLISFGIGVLSFATSPPHCPSDKHIQEIASVAIGSLGILGSCICCYFLAKKIKTHPELAATAKCQAIFSTILLTAGVVLNILGIGFSARCL